LKRKVSSAVFVAYLTACFSLLVIAPASIIFQAVVGGAMAIGLTVKVFWRRITTFFSRKRS
jgi:hypothetical protein